MLIVFIATYSSEFLTHKVVSLLSQELGIKAELAKAELTFLPPGVLISSLKIDDESAGASKSNGKKNVFNLNRAKAYFSIPSLIKKQIAIKSIYIDGISVDTDKDYIDSVLNKLNHNKKPSANKQTKSSKKFTVSISSVKLKDAKFKYKDGNKHYEFNIKYLYSKLGYNFDNIKLEADELELDYKGKQKILSDKLRIKSINAKINRTESGGYLINDFSLNYEGVNIALNGAVTSKDNIVVSPHIVVNMPYIKQMLSLKQNGDGKITIDGKLAYDGRTINSDLSLEGMFYLETLLEIARVKEPLYGEITFKGKATGDLKSLNASADISFRNGGFYGVKADTIKCDMVYKDNKMRFLNGKGTLYNG
ncbi:hypothetical protein MCHI_000489, partial [Candidatus Magnetoovum chiemensis]